MVQRTHGSGIIGATSTEAGAHKKEHRPGKRCGRPPLRCAGMVGTSVDEAAMTSPQSLRTRTIAFTFIGVVMLGFEKGPLQCARRVRGPLCFVLDTVGTMRGSIGRENHCGADASMSRNAFLTACFPDGMSNLPEYRDARVRRQIELTCHLLNKRLVGTIEGNAIRDILRRDGGCFIFYRSDNVRAPRAVLNRFGEQTVGGCCCSMQRYEPCSPAIDTHLVLILRAVGAGWRFIKSGYRTESQET